MVWHDNVGWLLTGLKTVCSCLKNVVVAYERALGTGFDCKTEQLFTKCSLTEDGRLQEVVTMSELTAM